MAENPPLYLQGGTHPAQNFRRLTEAFFGVREGVIGTDSLLVSQKSGTTNMSVDISAGDLVIAGTENADQGAYFCSLRTNPTNVAIAASDVTNARKDLVVATVRDSAYSGVDDDWIIQVVTGTPAATPLFPAVPANSYVLATVDIAANDTAINDADVTQLRNGAVTDGVTTLTNYGFASAVGGEVVCRSSIRPPSPTTGMRIYEVDTTRGYRWDGSAWRLINRDDDGLWQGYTPTIGGIAGATVNNARYTRIGDTCHVHVDVTVGASGTAAAVTVGLPLTAHANMRDTYGFGHAHGIDASSTTRYSGVIKIESSGTSVSFWRDSASGEANSVWYGSTTPFVWVSSDTLRFSITYEVA